MKFSLILLIASSVSAFTVVRPTMGVSMVARQAKAAKDHDEDLAMTREVIAKFMDDVDGGSEGEEKKDEKEPVAAKEE